MSGAAWTTAAGKCFQPLKEPRRRSGAPTALFVASYPAPDWGEEWWLHGTTASTAHADERTVVEPRMRARPSAHCGRLIRLCSSLLPTTVSPDLTFQPEGAVAGGALASAG